MKTKNTRLNFSDLFTGRSVFMADRGGAVMQVNVVSKSNFILSVAKPEPVYDLSVKTTSDRLTDPSVVEAWVKLYQWKDADKIVGIDMTTVNQSFPVISIEYLGISAVGIPDEPQDTLGIWLAGEIGSGIYSIVQPLVISGNLPKDSNTRFFKKFAQAKRWAEGGFNDPEKTSIVNNIILDGTFPLLCEKSPEEYLREYSPHLLATVEERQSSYGRGERPEAVNFDDSPWQSTGDYEEESCDGAYELPEDQKVDTVVAMNPDMS